MTADLDMSAFRLMDFGTRRRFSREVQEAIVQRLQQEPGLSAPATTIWRAVSI
jgi:nicotinate phosphoribosyltransferase